MNDDLVKRLRKFYWRGKVRTATAHEAADRIEALTAENERLKREVMLQMGWKTEAQNEIERLREALKIAALWTAEPGTTIAEIRTALGEME